MYALFFVFFVLAFGIAALVTWVYALIDIIKDDYKNDTDKILWFLLVFFLPFLGTIAYYLIGRTKVSNLQEEYV